jgi:hypothetical protein
LKSPLNRYDRSNIFRPWGYQPGHVTEWAKLLCQLDAHLPKPWHLPRAAELFYRAWSTAWDPLHGGMHYGFAPDDSICDPAKYHWVQAETLAAAALLALRTSQARYRQAYHRQWQYCWQHFVDHQQGAWFRILTADNFNVTREKSPRARWTTTTLAPVSTCGAPWALQDPAPVYERLDSGCTLVRMRVKGASSNRPTWRACEGTGSASVADSYRKRRCS